ncbi:hypothetical protein LDENG_00220120 [Lucifuga dentata]|nr:hypothetical protein LDENG_00220120 [Lucifuga dentata]
MCQVPVFCWITAMVLEDMLTREQRGELPKSLTDMYAHFLLVQTKRKRQKYDEEQKMNQQEPMECSQSVFGSLLGQTGSGPKDIQRLLKVLDYMNSCRG